MGSRRTGIWPSIVIAAPQALQVIGWPVVQPAVSVPVRVGQRDHVRERSVTASGLGQSWPGTPFFLFRIMIG